MNLHETRDSYQGLFIDVVNFEFIEVPPNNNYCDPDSDFEQEYLNKQPYFTFSEVSESKETVDDELDSRHQFKDLSKANEFITHLQVKLSKLNENSKTLQDNEKEHVSQISKLYEQNFTLTNQLNILEASRNSIQEENVELKKKFKKEISNWGAKNLEHCYHFVEIAKKDSDKLLHTYRSQNDDKKKEIEALQDEILELRYQNETSETSDSQLKGFETSLVLAMFKKSSQSAKALLRYTKYGALLHIYDFIMYSAKLGKMMIEDRLESALNATCGLGKDRDNEKLKERMLKFSKSLMQANVKKIFDEIHESSISLKKSINTYTRNQIEIGKLRGKIIHEARNSAGSGEISLLQLHEDLNEMQKKFMEASVYAFLVDPSLEIGPSDNKDSINKRDYMRNASFMIKIPKSVKQAIKKIPILPVLPGLFIRGEDGSITFKEKFFVSD
ncbi:hypothetical protein HK096_009282, partial [Nowakowskiella sp. JEL0078]